MNLRPFDKDLETKVRKTSEKISENLHIVGNEPSLAFYRIQEHVRKIVPVIVERQGDVAGLQQDLQGHAYDIEYALSAIKSFNDTRGSFNATHELLKNAIFLKQQLKYVESRRPNSSSTSKRESSSNSMYKRFSAHIPDLTDLSGVVRETTNRVENIVSGGGGGGGTVGNSSSAQRNSLPAPPPELQKSNTSMY